MRVALIWIVWLGLVLYWLTPEINEIKDKINEHNAQIERTINE